MFSVYSCIFTRVISEAAPWLLNRSMAFRALTGRSLLKTRQEEALMHLYNGVCCMLAALPFSIRLQCWSTPVLQLNGVLCWWLHPLCSWSSLVWSLGYRRLQKSSINIQQPRVFLLCEVSSAIVSNRRIIWRMRTTTLAIPFRRVREKLSPGTYEARGELIATIVYWHTHILTHKLQWFLTFICSNSIIFQDGDKFYQYVYCNFLNVTWVHNIVVIHQLLCMFMRPCLQNIKISNCHACV